MPGIDNSTPELKSIKIQDFSPGIVSANREAQSTFIRTTPLGSANEANTFRCIALPGGGLGPLPTYKTKEITNLTGPGNTVYCAGLQVFGPTTSSYFVQGGDEVNVQQEWWDSGVPTRRWRWDCIDAGFTWPASVNTGVGNLHVVDGPNTAGQTTGRNMGYASYCLTRFTSVSPYTAIGTPVLAVELSPTTTGIIQSSSIDGISYTRNAAFPPFSVAGPIASHQGRILQFQTQLFNHATGSDLSFISNETLFYTDPPNSDQIVANGYVPVPEDSTGISVWGSISAGELVIIKKYGGGALITGDLNNPQVTRLPGISSPGRYIMKGVQSPAGLIYCSELQGPMSWNGGNVSSPLAPQIHPNAFAPASDQFPASNVLPVIGCTHQWANWGNTWIMMNNNWLYDIRSGSFWKCESSSVFPHEIWAASTYTNQYIYSCPPTTAGNANNNIRVARWDQTLLASSYQWECNPIFPTYGRLIEMREIEVVVTGNVNDTVKFTFYNADGSTTVVPDSTGSTSQTFTLNSTGPRTYRIAMGCQAYNIRFQMLVTSATANTAPIVESIEVRYVESNQVAA